MTVMSSEKEQGKALLEWTEKNFMEQKVTTATRKDNILDLVFTNNENFVLNHEIIINSRLSDHNTVKINLNTEKEEEVSKKKENPYPNKIFEYNLLKGSKED